MSIMRTVLKGLIAVGICLPMIAIAGEDVLLVTNNTKYDSTSKSNGLFCSTKLGAIGITKAGATNPIQRKYVHLACATNPQNCQTEVYLTNNCTGSSIATVVIDARMPPDGIGLKSVVMHNPAYHIDGSGFTFVINPVT